MLGTDHRPAFSLPLTMTARRARRRSSGTFLRAAVDSGGAALRQIAREIADRFEMRRNRRVLASLDDRMLKDIGIVRGEIAHRVRAAHRAASRID